MQTRDKAKACRIRLNVLILIGGVLFLAERAAWGGVLGAHVMGPNRPVNGLSACRDAVHAVSGPVDSRAFHLLVALPGNPGVVLPPPWWTFRHTATLVGGMALVIALGLAWVWLLRRQVAEQTRRLQERLEREAALEQRYRELFENANDLIFTQDLEGHLTSLNAAAQRVLGYSLEEARRLTLDEIVAPEYREHARLLRESKLASGHVATCECEFVTKDGRRVNVEISAHLILRNGQPAEIQAIARDITARKRAEAALAETSGLFEALLENSPDLIYFKDRQSRFVRYSRAFIEQFNLGHPDALKGKSDFDLFTPEHARPAFEDEQEIMRTGRPIVGKLERETHQDGRVTWALTTKMPWRDARGNIIGTFGISKDVTAIKEAEARLAEEQQLFRLLLDNIPDVIYFKDRQSRFVRVSRSTAVKALAHAAKVDGFELPSDPAAAASPETVDRFAAFLVGKSDFDLFTPEHAKPAFEDEQEIMRTGQPIVGKLEKETHPDGRVTWALTTKMPWRDAQGNIIGTFGVSKDITAIKEAEARLAEEQQLFRLLLDNIPDVIYFKDRQSRFVRVSRSTAVKALAHAAKVDGFDLPADPAAAASPETADRFAAFLVGKSDFDLFTEEHARPAFEDEQEIMRTGQPIVGKLEKETHPDGRVTWALTTKMPWRDAQGNIVGTFGVSKDITAIKEAEAELDAAHKRLLETSRLAGMAEVATDVLHNVGNVLNSVNVSCALVLERMQSANYGNLLKIPALLQEHAGRLDEFLTTDSRGRRIPEYLTAFGESMRERDQFVVGELQQLRDHIEHIKQIVAMQQSYARVAGVEEKVDLRQLVEDALQINAAALGRHEVEVRREFEPVPMVITDKHRVLQVLVNLIRNAKYALSDAQRPDKLMTVRVGTNGDGMVHVQVADNGVGIAPENLTRIFAHGFTTRRNGHGFGLHSSALAAKELGGTLRAHSDGPGQGAVFTLALPLQRPGAAA